MKRHILYLVCATACLSSCHIYKAYERPDSITADGIYRDPVSGSAPVASTDTVNMGNMPWREMFRDVKLQALI
ncbi:outer membrane protein oprM, partial [gut metagenome]